MTRKHFRITAFNVSEEPEDDLYVKELVYMVAKINGMDKEKARMFDVQSISAACHHFPEQYVFSVFPNQKLAIDRRDIESQTVHCVLEIEEVEILETAKSWDEITEAREMEQVKFVLDAIKNKN